jgi:predicted DCC family thiol-disulfide oxidoreductase YuxK
VPDDVPPHERRPIVLYDGTCGLCHRSVKWLVRRDRGSIWYAPLQGETATALRARFAIPSTLESVVLIDGDRMHLRSKVFLHAARYLTRPWRWARFFRWLPAFVLDPFYWIVAKLRYRLFGRYDTCTIPTTDQRARLLP